jgi:peptidoglycan hydrolase-like protein with peptidoglycan-binding domain
MGGPEAPGVTIAASVGRYGVNRAEDVRAVQAALNQLPTQFGGPNPKLAVDGDAGPKTKAAIDAFQLKQFGWKDGLIEVGGPTIGKLSEFVGGFGPVAGNGFGRAAGSAAPASDPTRQDRIRYRMERANMVLPFLKQAALDAIAALRDAVTYVQNDFIADIDHLQWRNNYRIADTYFAFGKQPAAQTLADLRFIELMCRRVATQIMIRLGELHGVPFGPPLFAIDPTDAPFHAFTSYKYSKLPRPKGIIPNLIYLCDNIDQEEPDRFRWILCHEMFHYVDDETESNYIGDHGYAGDALKLPHAQRLRNADNFALFTMHAAIGRPRVAKMHWSLQFL